MHETLTLIIYILIAFTPPILFLINKQLRKTAIEGLISIDSQNVLRLRMKENVKLSQEYNLIKKDLFFWRIRSSDNHLITYLRLIKFNEFILKKMAHRVDSQLDLHQLTLNSAIDTLKTQGLIYPLEVDIIDKQRKFRNHFVQDLGFSHDSNTIRDAIRKSLSNLNILARRMTSSEFYS